MKYIAQNNNVSLDVVLVCKYKKETYKHSEHIIHNKVYIKHVSLMEITMYYSIMKILVIHDMIMVAQFKCDIYVIDNESIIHT